MPSHPILAFYSDSFMVILMPIAASSLIKYRQTKGRYIGWTLLEELHFEQNCSLRLEENAFADFLYTGKSSPHLLQT